MTISHQCMDLSIVREPKICPFSCSFLLCFKPYSTQFLNPYRLPNWWYLRLGIRVITHSFEFFGSVSGSVVISQNCSARRLPKIISRDESLLERAIGENPVKFTPAIASNPLPNRQPDRVIAWRTPLRN